ncbi:hypothetical protein MRB53_027130 [Persea americana]|uniref:Uncharacterized protein n=1 Tax=Persea americana TaxID=3435 RepID=A0ACC2LL66_PERAE|nr:hypothetical protein MRB53_027130 [Persea americana]
MRRPTHEEDKGLASLADKETGVCEKNHLVLASDHRKPRTFMAFSSQRFGFFKDEEEQPPRHFLDACYLCRKPLGPNTDIFMYRGDTPFCSEGCRQEQMDIDEAMEKNRGLSNIRVTSSKDPQKSATNKGKSRSFNQSAGTMVAG